MKIDKILVNFLIMPAIYLLPFLPLVVIPEYTYFPFTSGRGFLFRILTEILLVAWGILALRNPVYRPRRNPVILAYLVFVAIISISGLAGTNPEKSFWSSLERMEGIITYLHLFGFLIVLISIARVHSIWRTLFHLHMVAGWLMATYCLYEWSMSPSDHRLAGLTGNPAFLATYCLFQIFAAIFLATSRTKSTKRFGKGFYYGLAVAAQLSILYASGTRGTVIGLAAGIIFSTGIFVFWKNAAPKLRRFSIGLLALLLVLIGSLALARNTELVKGNASLARLAVAGNFQASAKARLIVWGAALKGAADHPMLGWGPENFNLILGRHFDPRLYDHSPWFDRAHNVILEWLCAAGILGLGAYLAIFGIALFFLWKRRSDQNGLIKILIAAILVAYLVQNLFLFDDIISSLFFITILGSIATAPVGSSPIAPTVLNRWSAFPNYYWAIIGMVAFALVSYGINYRAIKHNLLLARAAYQKFPQGPLGNLEAFKTILDEKAFSQREAIEELYTFMTGVANWRKLGPKLEDEWARYLVDSFDHLIAKNPLDDRPLIMAARFRIRLRHFEHAVALLEKAREIAPRKQFVLIQLAHAYLLMGNKQKTEEVLKYTYELAPNYPLAKTAYIESLRINKKDAEAERIEKQS